MKKSILLYSRAPECFRDFKTFLLTLTFSKFQEVICVKGLTNWFFFSVCVFPHCYQSTGVNNSTVKKEVFKIKPQKMSTCLMATQDMDVVC